MNEKTRKILSPCRKLHSEETNKRKEAQYFANTSCKINDRLLLDKNISNIIDKYKTLDSNKSQENSRNLDVDEKISKEETMPLKIINAKTSFGRDNKNIILHDLYKSENIGNSKANKNEACSVPKSIERSDKTTYCRPVTKKYYVSQKIVEKNNSLKAVVQNLSLKKQKEVEESLLNRYIYGLKRKHLTCIPEERQSFSYIQDIIGSKPRTKYYSRAPGIMLENLKEKYNPTIKLLHQKSRDTFYSVEELKRSHKQICYPVIRSPCKILHIPRSSKKSKMQNVKTCSTQVTNKNILTNQINRETKRILKNCVTQVNSVQVSRATIFQPENIRCDKSSMIISEKNETVVATNHTEEEKTMKSFVSIENKIEILLQSMNHFINEMRLQRTKQDNNVTGEGGKLVPDDKLPILPREESMDFNFETFKNIVNYTGPPSATAQIDHNLYKITSSDMFLNTYKTNFEKINEKSSIEIKFEVPTRDGCTEITNSFSCPIPNCSYLNGILDYTRPTEKKKTTIALNTDPISLVALWKISSEALKGLFTFDFHSYLPYLQLPRLQWGEQRPCLCDSDGSNRGCTRQNPNRYFNTESYLSNFATIGPFKCKYCDKNFSKACSWEMHVFSCSRSLGRHLKITDDK